MGYNLRIMMKCLAILTVLLAATSPMPGQTVKPSAQGGDKSENRSQNNQGGPAQALPLVSKQIHTVPADPNGASVAGDDKEHSVKLTSLPPVMLADKGKTFWDHVLDWGPWVFNLFLVLVGVLQVVLLKRTWKTIERQTAAAARSTEAFINKERSRSASGIAISLAGFCISCAWAGMSAEGKGDSFRCGF